MQIDRRDFFGVELAAGTAGALRAEQQTTGTGKGDFHLGSVTYNLVKDYDVETIISLWKRRASRQWSIGPHTRMA
jgi:hypothetical protein